MRTDNKVKKLRTNLKIEDVVLLNFVNLDQKEREMVRSWRNNDKVRTFFNITHIITPHEHAKFIARLRSDSQNFYWLILGNKNKYIGVIYLLKIEYKNRSAFFGLYANPDFIGTGIGRKLIGLIKKIAFEMTDLSSLKLTVLENNIRAIHLYNATGFKFIRRIHTKIEGTDRLQLLHIMEVQN